MSGQGIVPVILCGGSGTRLWPRSRAAKPKPFLPLIGERTLFERTLLRCGDRATFAPPLIVTGTRLLDHVEAQLDLAPDARIIVEPEARNTAAAIALAAHSLPPEAVMLVCPSDHYIGDAAAFASAVDAASGLAREGWLVSLAIQPTRPETGFGYIRKGEALGRGFKVDEFVEKPDLPRAQAFLDSGNYVWNGGIFAFRAREFLQELAIHRPELAAAVARSSADGRWNGRSFHPSGSSFSGVKGESVDCAVMENTDRAAMVPADLDWSDIGNWPAVRDARDRDQSGNSVTGPVELIDCRNVLVDSDGPNVHVVGMEGVVIIVDGDDIVVTSTQGAQDVGRLKGAKNQ